MGLGALLGHLPGLIDVLALGGAVFLGWYGLSALRRALRPGELVAGGGGTALTLGKVLAQVAGLTLLNPHVYLDTVLLVGSVGAAQPAGAQVPFVMGAGLASAAWFAALGFGARLVAPLFARPVAWRVLDLAVGTTMIVLATGMVGYALDRGLGLQSLEF
jgi:L-lysine exporter family protein LysE/ArgO